MGRLNSLFPNTHYEMRLAADVSGLASTLVSPPHHLVTDSGTAGELQSGSPRITNRYRLLEEQEILCWQARQPDSAIAGYRVNFRRTTPASTTQDDFTVRHSTLVIMSPPFTSAGYPSGDKGQVLRFP